MQTSIPVYKEKKTVIKLITTLFLFATLILLLPHQAFAGEIKDTIYKDGIYHYIITNEDNKEARLIGVDLAAARTELIIPGTVSLNGQNYIITQFDVHWDYYDDTAYQVFYDKVKKLTIAENFKGTIPNPLFAFPNVRTLEFKGTITPQKVSVTLSNRSASPDVVFVVPEGYKAAYRQVIEETMSYYNGSDLYEMDIILKPTIANKVTDSIENETFAKDGLIYQVTASAKQGAGKVQLIGITNERKHSYLNLPKELSNNGYTYQLTKLCKFSLIHIGATVIVVPDTVTELETSVFDKQVELLFLSKNIKQVPTTMIADENGESNLRFVYVPEGVTTVSDRAFASTMKNKAGIILPTSIKSLGKQSLYGFKYVTFLNKKPITKLSSAISSSTTVKVNATALSAYRKALGSKIPMEAAKNVVKATKLTVAKSSLTLNTTQTATLKGYLTKGSNETVFWLSSDTKIFDVSSKGVVSPKKAGSAYVFAYTRTSGLYKAVKVTVTNKVITSGILSYRVTDAARKTVSLYQIKPIASTKKITIPETITHSGKSYKVTGAITNPDDPTMPMIGNAYKDNKIEAIVFPKTITGDIGYLGELRSIKSITFLGKTAPDTIQYWYKDGGLLAFQAVIYVPKGSVASYSSILEVFYSDDTYSEKNYGYWMDYNVVEIGSGQLQRFVKDGVLYKVTKKAGTSYGEVIVVGADVSFTKLTIKDKVSYGKYTYRVTKVSRGALDHMKAAQTDINTSVKIQK